MGSIKRIMLTNSSKRFLIDDGDYELVKRWKWRLNSQGYVQRSLGNVIFLHRLLLGAPQGYLVDHINRNPLDNRRSNLRLCTPSENNINMKTRVDNKSGTRGVTWHKAARKWCAEIKFQGKKNYLGLFDNKQDAIDARKRAELKVFGGHCG